jgi:hypothetical protein
MNAPINKTDQDETTDDTGAVDTELLTTSVVLRDRAASLRTQARGLSPLVAGAYARRAAELELEAWIAEVQAGVPAEEVHAAA